MINEQQIASIVLAPVLRIRLLLTSGTLHLPRSGMGKKWLPLESNPDVLNDFSRKLGLDTSQCSFHDVYGMDPVNLTLFRFSDLYTGGQSLSLRIST